jgi:Domain of unknown function (DUF4149)
MVSMSPESLRRLDLMSLLLLLLWVGMALGFGVLTAPLLFANLPSRDLAGRLAGLVIERLDWAAWIAFGGAFALSFLPRWLAELKEPDAVGPFRLWTAAALAALLMCLASSFIFTPKLREIRARMAAPVEALAPEHPDRLAYQKAHKLSRQFFFLRVLLAAGLALGLAWLPRNLPKPPRDP